MIWIIGAIWIVQLIVGATLISEPSKPHPTTVRCLLVPGIGWILAMIFTMLRYLKSHRVKNLKNCGGELGNGNKNLKSETQKQKLTSNAGPR